MNAEPTLSLALTERDAQWVAAALAVCSTFVSEYEDDFANNANALLMLYARAYSASEVNGLNCRVRELVPLDSPILITDRPFLTSTSTLVS